MAFDFLLSFVGLVCLGGALWVGVGGYVSGALASRFGLPLAGNLALATFGGAALCTLLFLPCLTLRDIYFAIASFVYPFIFLHVIEALQIFGGTEGLIGLPTFPNKWVAIYLMAILLLLSFFALRRLGSEDVGLVIRAIRENDQAVKASGINIIFWKAVVTFAASLLGCFAGAYLCALYGWTGMSYFALDFSILPIACLVLGGFGNFSGSLIGAFILVPLSELLRAFGPVRMVVYAAILAFFVVARPEGIMPYLTRKYHQFERWVEV
jgi:branched-chain amino acid transport system permease protein